MIYSLQVWYQPKSFFKLTIIIRLTNQIMIFFEATHEYSLKIAVPLSAKSFYSARQHPCFQSGLDLKPRFFVDTFF